jgi:integrase
MKSLTFRPWKGPRGWLKLPNGKALTGFQHDYTRHGTTTLFAALEVATGLVKGDHYKRLRRVEFLDFMNGIVAGHPDRQIHVILDNLNTHKPKGRASRVGWDPFRTILLIMLDSGLRPGEIYRMRWENIHWEQGMIFNPRGKSRKSKRYVPLTERMKSALLSRPSGSREGWVFPSKKAASGHITDREVSKQWLEAKRLAGISESVVLYCARHRFATDAMQATGNIMAVMDAMGHERVDTLRIYSHPELAQIREAMNKRNEAMQ